MTFCILVIMMLSVQGCSWHQRDFNKEVIEESEQDLAQQTFDIEEDVAEKFNLQAPVEQLSQPLPTDPHKSQDPVDQGGIGQRVVESSPTSANTKAEPRSHKRHKKIEKNEKELALEAFEARDNVSAGVWGQFKPRVFIGEKKYFNIHYLGVTIGKIFILTKDKTVLNDDDVYHFYARLKSAPFYRYLYVLDDVIESFVSTDKFIPVKYSLVQRESKKDIDDMQLFDHGQRTSYFRYKKVKNGEVTKRKEDHYTPLYFQDAFSALYFIRGLPLENKDRYEFPIITRGKLTIFDLKVLGREEIQTPIGKKRAIKAKAFTRYSGDFVKKGEMTFWFSDDEKRIFLKFKAIVKIGSVWGEIVDYESP